MLVLSAPGCGVIIPYSSGHCVSPLQSKGFHLEEREREEGVKRPRETDREKGNKREIGRERDSEVRLKKHFSLGFSDDSALTL